MKVELKIEPGLEEPRIVIHAGAETEDIRRLIQDLSGRSLGPISVWEGDRTMPVPQSDFLRFYTEGKGVTAQTVDGTYAVRLRLYELEEVLDATRFVRISNSEIINLDRVTAVDLSLAGTIRMTLDRTVPVYVSRRYVKKIKETLGLGRRKPS